MMGKTRATFSFAGNIYNGIYVFGITEAISKAHEEEREKASITSVEEVVHPNSLCTKVITEQPYTNKITYLLHLMYYNDIC